MGQPTTQSDGYCFGDIHIDARNRQLWRGGQLVPLNSKYFDVLLLLVCKRGQLVEKQHLFDEVWDGVFVTDAALTQCIKDIRKQLGDDASNPRYIKTVPKHGYIFIAHVSEIVAGKESSLLSSPQVTAPKRPYKFLDYYTELDAPLFFGRESEVDTICSRIIAHRSFILHGRSGVGKSSIARAGIMPRLKAEGHRVFVLNSFTDPLAQMIRIMGETPSVGDGRAAAQLLKDWFRKQEISTHERIVFLLDQFEDSFTSLRTERGAVFADCLAELYSEKTLPLRFVFILREDLLAEMSELKRAIPEIFHHEYRLQRLTREQAVRAILEPTNLTACQFESELVGRILMDLSEEGRVDPPQLQIVCDTLYDARDSSGSIRLAAYESLGTASLILSNYFERVLSRLNAADFRLAQELLKFLISPDAHRLVVRATELEMRVRNAAAGESISLERLEQELTDARILRSRTQDGERWLELAHEFIIPEISRWLSSEDRLLLEARAVLKRAMENYRAYRLYVDPDALTLLLRFGERLCLMPDEADLLVTSILHRAGDLPSGLVEAAPSSRQLIADATRHPDLGVRMCAARASGFLRDEETKKRLRALALWDPALAVREVASIELARWLGAGVVEFLAARSQEGEFLPSAISLAFIRDVHEDLVVLPQKSIPLSVLVLVSLLWLRLRREGRKILRGGMGGTLGGAASGLLGSLLLGVALTTARRQPMNEAISLIFVLTSLGVVIGALGGLGVSFGIALGACLSQRQKRLWAVITGAAGGAAIGGGAKLLGVDALKALFGQNPSGVTGSFEGAIIGAGVAVGAVVIGREMPGSRAWRAALGMGAGGLLAGAILAIIGGNLFSGSLEVVARSFADSRIRMDPIASFFGETKFGRTTQVILGAVEGLLFGTGVGACLRPGRLWSPRLTAKERGRAGQEGK